MSTGCIFTYDVLTQTSYFEIQSINVSGNSIRPTEMILEMANVHEGMNLLSLKVYNIKDILEADPWIISVEVDREFNHNQLNITVKERNPVAVFVIQDQKLLMDDQFSIFKELEPDDPVQVPYIFGFELYDLPFFNEELSLPFQAICDSLTILNQSPLIKDMIQLIDVDRDIGISLFTHDRQVEIQMGYSQYNDKFKQLQRLLTYLTTQKIDKMIQYIDLTDIYRIVVRKRLNEKPTARRDNIECVALLRLL